MFLKSKKENTMVDQCWGMLKNAGIHNEEKFDFKVVRIISEDLDKLLLSRQLLQQTMIYARYHAKAKSSD